MDADTGIPARDPKFAPIGNYEQTTETVADLLPALQSEKKAESVDGGDLKSDTNSWGGLRRR